MCVFQVLKKWNFFPNQVRVNGRKNLKISGRRGGGCGAGERLAFRESQPHQCSPQQWTHFLHPTRTTWSLSHCPPWTLEKEVLWGTLSPPPAASSSCRSSLPGSPHSQLSPTSHSPHENQATASWIILKASEAGRTWQHPACSPSSLSGSHCRLLYKAQLSSHPTCPSLLLPALGSMDW